MNCAIFIPFFLFALIGAVPLEQASRRGHAGTVGCRNERNEPVDWYIVYKLPEIPSSKSALEKEGLAHVYMDESTGGWTKSSISFDTDQHAVANTLDQLYKSKKDGFHVMYNDETPDDKKSSTKGHAKGVAMFDKTSGFWLVHSVPKFPSANRYSYPDGGRKFGQMLLCIAFGYENFEEIAKQLQLFDPLIYSSSLPAEIEKEIEKSSDSTLKRELKLQSSGGVTFTSFAKAGKWGGELYADFVAPSLKQSLYVETWRNGRGDIPSSCKGSYQVTNVDEVQIENVDFTTSKDHSKWVVSSGKSSDWICVGGVNRQHGQLSRGGGTVCMKNKSVWKAFYSTVKSTEACK